jgi:mycothiol synthase
MVDGNPSPQIGCPSAQARAEALELVFGHLPPDQRRLQIGETLLPPVGAAVVLPHPQIRDGSITATPTPLDGLFEARRNGRLVGAMFSQASPGRTATVWLPRLADGESESTAARLYDATWEFLARQQVVLAQILLPTVSAVEAGRLRQGEFRRLASLLYLVSLEGEFPTEPPDTQLEFEPYSATNSGQWGRVYAATCQGTLDCANLADPREPDDVLAAYRAAGAFNPHLWLLVRHRQRVCGCVILADHPRHETTELLYLGLVPAARGRGLGRQLARQSQWLARRLGRRRLVLAVDAANVPAVQTYAAVDFQTWQCRQLYVRAFHWHGRSEHVFHDGRCGAA